MTTQQKYVVKTPSGAVHIYSKKPANWGRMVGQKEVYSVPSITKGSYQEKVVEGAIRSEIRGEGSAAEYIVKKEQQLKTRGVRGLTPAQQEEVAKYQRLAERTGQGYSVFGVEIQPSRRPTAREKALQRAREFFEKKSYIREYPYGKPSVGVLGELTPSEREQVKVGAAVPTYTTKGYRVAPVAVQPRETGVLKRFDPVAVETKPQFVWGQLGAWTTEYVGKPIHETFFGKETYYEEPFIKGWRGAIETGTALISPPALIESPYKAGEFIGTASMYPIATWEHLTTLPSRPKEFGGAVTGVVGTVGLSWGLGKLFTKISTPKYSFTGEVGTTTFKTVGGKKLGYAESVALTKVGKTYWGAEIKSLYTVPPEGKISVGITHIKPLSDVFKTTFKIQKPEFAIGVSKAKYVGTGVLDQKIVYGFGKFVTETGKKTDIGSKIAIFPEKRGWIPSLSETMTAQKQFGVGVHFFKEQQMPIKITQIIKKPPAVVTELGKMHIETAAKTLPKTPTTIIPIFPKIQLADFETTPVKIETELGVSAKPFTKIAPDLKTVSAPSIALVTPTLKTRVGGETKLKPLSGLKTNLKSMQQQMTGIKQMKLAATPLLTKTVSKARQKLAQSFKFKTPTQTRVTPYRFDFSYSMPKTTIAGLMTPFKFPKGRKRKKKKWLYKPPKQPKKYRPSVAGIVLGWKVAKIPKIRTGLEIRPVVMRKKKRRKR